MSRALVLLLISMLFPMACLPAQAWPSNSALSLDVRNAAAGDHQLLRPYMIRLRQTIESRWSPRGGYREKTARVFFIISATGVLLQEEIQDSSGDKDFDQSVFDAVRTSAPFIVPPVGHMLSIVATFRGKNFRGITQKAPTQVPTGIEYARTIRRQYVLPQTHPTVATPVYQSQQQPIYQEQYEPKPIYETRNTADSQPSAAPTKRVSSNQLIPKDGYPFFGREPVDYGSSSSPKTKSSPLKPTTHNIASATTSAVNMFDSDEDFVKRFRFLPSATLSSLSAEQRSAYEENIRRWKQIPLIIRFGAMPD